MRLAVKQDTDAGGRVRLAVKQDTDADGRVRPVAVAVDCRSL